MRPRGLAEGRPSRPDTPGGSTRYDKGEVAGMTLSQDTVRDRHGRPMFVCPDCGEALTADDVFEHGLRLPDCGETRDEYFEAELLDNLGHVSCLRARRAS